MNACQPSVEIVDDNNIIQNIVNCTPTRREYNEIGTYVMIL